MIEAYRYVHAYVRPYHPMDMSVVKTELVLRQQAGARAEPGLVSSVSQLDTVRGHTVLASERASMDIIFFPP